MSVCIIRQTIRKKRGLCRYSISYSSGIPVEFVIHSPPTPQTREWQIMFSRSLRAALEHWEKVNGRRREDKS